MLVSAKVSILVAFQRKLLLLANGKTIIPLGLFPSPLSTPNDSKLQGTPVICVSVDPVLRYHSGPQVLGVIRLQGHTYGAHKHRLQI